MVEESQLLVRMKSDDLELEFEKVSGQIDTIEQQIKMLDSGRLRNNNPQERTGESIEIQRVSLVNQLANLKRQQTLLAGRRENLQVTVPLPVR